LAGAERTPAETTSAADGVAPDDTEKENTR